jgi:hypothetical protein
MDEEDGRPGARARKFGPTDVLTDAVAKSLCRPIQLAQFQNTPYFALQSRPLRTQSRTSHCGRFSALVIQTQITPSQTAPFHWRGPAEGVRPTAGGGEAS